MVRSLGRDRDQILSLDLTPFASSTFQFVPTDSGHSSEVQVVSLSKNQLVECWVLSRSLAILFMDESFLNN